MSLRLLIAGLLFISSGSAAWATTLGNVQGEAWIGQPLSIQIPVEMSRETATASNCFKLQAPARQATGNDAYLLRQARLEQVNIQGKTVLRLSGPAVREPVVEFAIVDICGSGLMRDYVLFAEPPVANPPVAVAVADPPGVAAPHVSPANASPAEPELSLLQLARQRYPLQPKARVKFIRMMLQENPGIADANQPIPAGTRLAMPTGLPQQRAARPPEQRRPSTPPKPAADRLKISTDTLPASIDGQIIEELARLIPLMREQNQSQDALIRKLARMELDYQALQQRFADTEAQVAQLKAQPASAPPPPQPENLPQQPNILFELILAALIGGLVTGIAIVTAQHLIARRKMAWPASNMDWPLPVSTPPQAAAAPSVFPAAAAAPIVPMASVEPAPDAPAPVMPAGPAPTEQEAGDPHPFDFDLGALPSNMALDAKGQAALDFSVSENTVQTK